MTDREQAYLQVMIELDGMEVGRNNWPTVQSLVDQGKAIWMTGPRGPNRAFRRAVATTRKDRI